MTKTGNGVVALLLATTLAAVGLAATGKGSGAVAPIEVIFFDIGDTLVKRGPDRSFVWIDGAQEAIAVLQQAGVRVGLMSNTGDLTREVLFEKLMPADFDPGRFEAPLILLSSEVGIEKPAAGIYRRAIEVAAVEPGATMFLAETLSHVLAAQAEGMRAVWLQEGDLGPMVKELVEAGLAGPG